MLTVRSMQLTDLDDVYRIETSAHRTPWSRGILDDCVLVGYDCRVLELTDAGSTRIVGYIICRLNFNTCHILNLCIEPSCQNKGFGKFFLGSVLDSLAGGLTNTVILEVRPTNSVAIMLYEAFGFQRDEIKKGYYKDDKGEEDALLLKKILPR